VDNVPSLAILVSAVLVLSCGQTERQTDRITDTDQRYTHATTVGVSTLICTSYEPLKHSGMDHTAFTLQIHHICIYLVAFTRRRHYWLVVAAIWLQLYWPREDERLSRNDTNCGHYDDDAMACYISHCLFVSTQHTKHWNGTKLHHSQTLTNIYRQERSEDWDTHVHCNSLVVLRLLVKQFNSLANRFSLNSLRNAAFTPGHMLPRNMYPGRATCIEIRICRRTHVACSRYLLTVSRRHNYYSFIKSNIFDNTNKSKINKQMKMKNNQQCEWKHSKTTMCWSGQQGRDLL